jgi:hypothetical protein
MRNTDAACGNEQPSEKDALDVALDAALRKYSAVEPRAGLEQRILAQLQTECSRLPNRSWWRWSAAGAIAALLAFTLTLAWRSSRTTTAVVRPLSTPIERVRNSTTRVAVDGGTQATPAIRPQHRVARHRSSQPLLAADEPKLDQFPSYRPLSEHEKLALEYVERFPKQASLMAQAQTNLARQQELEQRQEQRNSQ